MTVIGDSVATGVLWNEKALAILGQGVDLQMQVAVCRRLTGESCPYEGSQASTVVDLVASLGPRVGPTVIMVVGYNDFQRTFASSVEASVRGLLGAGVERILWATLRAARRPYLTMNADLWAAAAAHPELTIVDWNEYARAYPGWFQNDGLHLTRAGGVALATLLRAALVPQEDPPSIVLPASGLSVARLGRKYETRLSADGGAPPYRWAVVSGTLPTGLRLRPDGRIAGTPRRAGSVTVVLRARDANGATAIRRAALVVAR
ncbi:putative Ig domain-containing protein [Gaiella occulta]|uniref:putative Ig domain-containing protein n=1 Tax=Gaiella occulta TaxID=1002870 RepID=UPI0011C06099|nr:putative Ig domain-containing protein [Gaiella occulta]